MLHRNQSRRGITLLMVISLVVMFFLAGTTFFVVAAQYLKSARVSERKARVIAPPKNFVDEAMYIVLRGTTNPNSAIRSHSILEDKYNPAHTITGTVALGAPGDVAANKFRVIGIQSTDAQFVAVQVNPSTLSSLPGFPALNLSPIRGAYNGCEFTFTNGIAAGITTRIVDWNGTDTFFIMIEKGDASGNVFPPAANQIKSAPYRNTFIYRDPANVERLVFDGNSFIINGRPFTGTGAGFNPGLVGGGGAGVTRELLTKEALLPNRKGETANNSYTNYTQGGLNESYDVPDFQNCHLAAIMGDPNSPNGYRILPSYHRPALINYMLNNPSSPAAAASSPKDYIFRPIPPTQFTANQNDPNNKNYYPSVTGYSNGANADFPYLKDIINGPFDVDNDNDLVAESVWVDIGLPVQTDADGNRYKPLAAILVVDLDGRLNVNAHGNLWHYQGNSVQYAKTWNINYRPTDPATHSATFRQRGQGYGPAEISLNPLLTTGDYGASRFTQILNERYGMNNKPGRADFEVWSRVRLFEFPANFNNARTGVSSLQSSFASPPDIHGRFSVGVGPRGEPLYEMPLDFSNVPVEMQHNAYQMDLSRDASFGPGGESTPDNPFSMAEMEKILRSFDSDAGALSSRLWNLFPNTQSSPDLRFLMTTASYDFPGPGVTPLDGVAIQQAPRSVDDLLRARLNPALKGVSQVYEDYLAPEVRMGLRMDINRILGDGRDNNNNGVVDEISFNKNGAEANTNLNESAGNEIVSHGNVSFPIDHDNDGNLNNDNDAWKARQLLAKQLYILMRLTMDPLNISNPNDAEKALAVAQYAINIVDFRDADSIMTPFAVDLAPFDADGWSVDDANPQNFANNPSNRLIFGCERPELLLNEVTAQHDRRTKDLAAPGGKTGGNGMGNGMGNDQDFDQYMMPHPSLFIELYNPNLDAVYLNAIKKSGNGKDWFVASRSPREFYTPANGAAQGIDLRRRTGPSLSPVWRIAVVDESGASIARDLNDPDRSQRPNIERSIYFANPQQMVAAAGASLQHGLAFWPNPNIVSAMKPLLGGQFAVLGSATVRNTNTSFQTPFGRRVDAVEGDASSLKLDSTQSVLLSAGQPLRLIDNLGNPVVVNSTMGIPIDQPRSVNISDPINGYPTDPMTGEPVDQNGNPATPVGDGFKYALPSNEPLDSKLRPNGDPDALAIMTNGTTPAFRVLHLQRLANPLIGFHAVLNPYITIDSMFVDLVAFNGLGNDDPQGPGGPMPPGNPMPPGLSNGITDGNTYFYSLERGFHEAPDAALGGGAGAQAAELSRQVWKSEPARILANPNDTPNAGAPTHYFNYEFVHSLGRPTRSYDRPAFLATPNAVAYPWLAWHNRPYVNKHELLQVPMHRASQLLNYYTIDNPGAGSPYQVNPNQNLNELGRHPSYGHLINFFEGSNTAGEANNLSRFLEYVGTRSFFVGTETYLNPNIAAKFASTIQLHPPFHRISRYRDPGKINLNTIYDTRIWWGLNNSQTDVRFDQLNETQPMDFASTYQQFVGSRRGYGGLTGPTWTLNQTYPTLFANPFRPAGAARLVPPISNGGGTTLVRNDVEATIMRSRTTNTTPGNESWLARSSHRAFDDTRRNPYFKYDQLSRLTNLTTTRSNVYAMWVTVGRFEVDRNGLVGREVGSETGDTQRHRGFYMIDRSIPVALEPGNNHNVDRGVLVRRVLD